MRGVIGRRINNPNNSIIPNVTTKLPAFSFCSGSSGSGRGRGRGVPTGSSPFEHFTPSKPLGQPASESKSDSPPPPPSGTGRGHGHGHPSAPISQAIPSFSAFISSVRSGSGRGLVSESDPNESTRPGTQAPKFVSSVRSGSGRGLGSESDPNESTRPGPQAPKPRTFTPTESATDSTQRSKFDLSSSSITSVLPGAGRGKTAVTQQQQQQRPSSPIKEENRHIRPRAAETRLAQPKLSREDAMKKAMQVLSQGGEIGGEGISADGPGRGMGRGRGRGRMRREGMGDDEDERFASGLYLGDNADGEKLAEKLGAEKMNMLVEAFEEMSGTVLPSPIDDAYLDALDLNYKIEFEPEFMMEEFGVNPDIDEKPPIPLRDALEQMKPFLMAYEGIQSHEEWEEAVNEVMERVPLLKEIVDHYSGPDRVTAKQQGEELERVAKSIPDSAPTSIKRFANRAVLSLQSNPGWGFDKKCQFMDKLLLEASQNYK